MKSQRDEAVATTSAESALVVERWLLGAAPNRDLASAEWKDSGVALLRCGTLFAAVAVSAAVVHAAAGTSEPDKVDSFLAVALHGGPTFVDRQTQQYYFLVEASAQGRQEWSPTRLRHDANLLGCESYLGVPSVGATDRARTRWYWCVPMVTPAGLGSAEAVSQLLAVGRLKRATSGEGMNW